jgi:hypothetical protein
MSVLVRIEILPRIMSLSRHSKYYVVHLQSSTRITNLSFENFFDLVNLAWAFAYGQNAFIGFEPVQNKVLSKMKILKV